MFTVAVLLAAASLAPVARAVAYLSREVPRWSKQNHCYSCHNNGDGARALYAARRLGYEVPAQALADTTEWLRHPLGWDDNRGDPRFSDKRLARIQFAASLVEAMQAGVVTERQPLAQAAESLLPHQAADGSWPVDAQSAVGSPVTYGPALATYLARRTLEQAGAARFQAAINKAAGWLLNTPAVSVLDAAAISLALQDDRSDAAAAKRPKCFELIVGAQASDGGWGPYAHSPSEPFDTALALLALASFQDRPETAARIEQGRGYLVRAQLAAGGWTETTRPAGGQSYAQHVSTTGWCTLALLRTAPRSSGRDAKRK